ncbi:hypothetical protein [Apilactobacillus kunkeei]|uniref:hypothetical protein n=1 Tax=Apilactobacillus kunkeei TaxID=148814 RepID=UPI0015E8710A|nr:hypothetical protein [Apilactobacillus kunkeei]CAI2613852.1 hypothetical protein AKUH3B202X_01180 [Apilactobacillus kunkeei]
MFSKELKLAAIKDYYNGLGFTKITNKIRIKYAMVPYENQLNTFFNIKIPPN